MLWAIYRDDIYLPWVDSLENLYKFVDWLNNFHPDLKFEMSTPSTEGAEFLETFVYTKDGKLHTKRYCKPNDNHLYLIPSSCHPRHVIENNPYNIALRIFKICSEDHEYKKAKMEADIRMEKKM